MDGAVFEIRAAEQAWLSLAAEYSQRRQADIPAWKRLTHYYKAIYRFNLDKGLLRVIALFGEKRAEPFDQNSYLLQIGTERVTVQADPTSAQPTERYLLLKAADAVMGNEAMRAAIHEYVDSTHQKGSYNTDTDFALLDSELDDELKLAKQNQDTAAYDRLSLLSEMLKRLPQLKTYHE